MNFLPMNSYKGILKAKDCLQSMIFQGLLGVSTWSTCNYIICFRDLFEELGRIPVDGAY